jgi:hypothetical protein
MTSIERTTATSAFPWPRRLTRRLLREWLDQRAAGEQRAEEVAGSDGVVRHRDRGIVVPLGRQLGCLHVDSRVKRPSFRGQPTTLRIPHGTDLPRQPPPVSHDITSPVSAPAPPSDQPVGARSHDLHKHVGQTVSQLGRGGGQLNSGSALIADPRGRVTSRA